ncbi:RecQ family ATP-dependent DNA helicase [Peribacillus sp. SCS-37]|uniref:RecQ family ATP-dependent DNA helicase n=1 Tax=Paraperibacillus esterisolvens TaxID=3115296 RepID=UPI0039057B73
MNLEKHLEKHFGYTSFRQGQKETVSEILRGGSTLSMLPTGTGKSLCYQLPAYIMDKPAVVVSPLLSLMQDQAEQLRFRGEKRVVSFNSFLSFEEKQKALRNISKYRFIFVSPEMLNSRRLMDALKEIDIGLFVIDEAHCISQWGYDFRPDYLNLGAVRASLGDPLTLALTATATPEVREDIIQKLGAGVFTQIISSVDRTNISMIVEKFTSYNQKHDRLIELAGKLQGPGIVYVSSKKTAEMLAELIQRAGHSRTAFYHGGMEQEQRVLIQQQFLNNELDIICATSAFGMGINKDNVRYVIHFQMPMQMESYLQEIGRAGRDGLESAAILLYMDGDEGLQLNLIENELPSGMQIKGLMNYLLEKKLQREEALQLLGSSMSLNQFSLSEVQLRIIQSFIKLDGGTDSLEAVGESILSFAEHRRNVKLKKLGEFLKWLDGPGCRREGIAAYFKQEAAPKPVYCCDKCGVSLSAYRRREEAAKFRKQVFNWKKELSEMLVPKKGASQ